MGIWLLIISEFYSIGDVNHCVDILFDKKNEK
jgi:hypothetical protein